GRELFGRRRGLPEANFRRTSTGSRLTLMATLAAFTGVVNRGFNVITRPRKRGGRSGLSIVMVSFLPPARDRPAPEGILPRPAPAQQNAVFRFFPSFPARSTLSMYSVADGTLHAVPPMSTSTLPIARATALAFAVSGTTIDPTVITK